MSLMPVAPVGVAALLSGRLAPAGAAVADPLGPGGLLAPLAGGASALLRSGAGLPWAPLPASLAAEAQPAAEPAPKPAPASPAPVLGPELPAGAKRAADQAFREFVAGPALEPSAKRRRHLFVVGPPGVGKTTLVQRLVARLREHEKPGALEIGGFYTAEVRDSAGQRSGFDVVRLGEAQQGAPSRAPLARHGTEPPKIGKYSINLRTLEDFAIPAIEPPQRELPPMELPENPRLCTFPDGRVEAVSFLHEEAPDASPAVGPALPDASPEGGSPAALPPPAASPAASPPSGSPPPPPPPVSSPGSPAAAASPPPPSSPAASPEAPAAWAMVRVPSSGLEERVELDRLSPVPDGWRPPDDPADDSDDDGPPKLTVCDEVGKMELLSIKFGPAINAALDSRASVLGTFLQPAKNQRDHEVVERIKRRADVKVFRISVKNRDALLDQAYTELRECLDIGAPGTVRPAKPKPASALTAEEAAAKAEEAALSAGAAKTAGADDAEAKKAERAAKRKEREEREREIARQRGEQAKRAREERKRRAESRAQLQHGASLELDDDDAQAAPAAQAAPVVDALIDDDEDLVATPVVLDVDSAAAAPKAAAKAGAAPGGAAAPAAKAGEDRAAARKARRLAASTSAPAAPAASPPPAELVALD